MASLVTCYYHCQNERGDTSSHPNAFKINPLLQNKITLEDIQKAFPLSGTGSFHFRFQVIQEKQPLYLDLLNPADAVPTINGNVIAKVLRLGAYHRQSCGITSAPLRLTAFVMHCTHGYADNLRCSSRLNTGLTLKSYLPSNAAADIQPPQPLSARGPGSSSGAGSVPSRSPPSTAPAGTANSPVTASAPAATAVVPPAFAMPTMKSGASLHVVPKETDGETHIRDDGTGYDIYKGLKAADERGMRPVKAVEDTGPVEVPDEVDDDLEGKSDYVKAKIMARRIELRKLQEARQAEIETKAAEESKESSEKDAAKAQFEAKLKEWALEPGGKVKNIRILLSTLHSVLWDGAKWEVVPMAKLVIPSKVKIHFMKAITQVHPDKQINMDGDQKYIATQIFHYIETSYREFQEKEMGG